MFAIVAFSVFALVVAGGWALALAVRARAEADYALEQRLGVAGRERAQRPASLLKDQRLSSIAPLDWILLRLPFVPGITRVIRQAGLGRRAGDVLM